MAIIRWLFENERIDSHFLSFPNSLANARPYREWIEKIRIRLDEVPAAAEKCAVSPASQLDRQQAFGYTQEDIKVILEPMAQSGEEPTGSMGTDSALPVLSKKNKTLYAYFKQLFAQVTNPPIDPIREELVMSLFGRKTSAAINAARRTLVEVIMSYLLHRFSVGSNFFLRYKPCARRIGLDITLCCSHAC